jgi:hypothetical protein
MNHDEKNGEQAAKRVRPNPVAVGSSAVVLGGGSKNRSVSGQSQKDNQPKEPKRGVFEETAGQFGE